MSPWKHKQQKNRTTLIIKELKDKCLPFGIQHSAKISFKQNINICKLPYSSTLRWK